MSQDSWSGQPKKGSTQPTTYSAVSRRYKPQELWRCLEISMIRNICNAVTKRRGIRNRKNTGKVADARRQDGECWAFRAAQIVRGSVVFWT